MFKTFILFFSFLLTNFFTAFSQKVTNDELLTILDIKAFRVPSFSKKQWTIEIISDTLQKRKAITIDKILSSKTNSLIAVKYYNDTTFTFTLIQNKNTSSQGTINLKQSRYDIIWNKFPELLYRNTFVIGTINYEQTDDKPLHNLTDLLVIQLINELKF
jgi:hypothetical protein